MLNLTRAVCLMALLLTSFVVTGCAGLRTQSQVEKEIAATAPEFCATAKPIYIAKTDQISDDTARQILAHNLTGRKLCKW